jgi:hypothetical protein
MASLAGRTKNAGGSNRSAAWNDALARRRLSSKRRVKPVKICHGGVKTGPLVR